MSLCCRTDDDDTGTEGQVRHHDDTMQEPTSVGECAVMVNGPEDDILNWYAIDWRTSEDDVRRLRQRIFTGLLEQDAVKVARPVLRGAGHSNAPGLPGIGSTPSGPTIRSMTSHQNSSSNSITIKNRLAGTG